MKTPVQNEIIYNEWVEFCCRLRKLHVIILSFFFIYTISLSRMGAENDGTESGIGESSLNFGLVCSVHFYTNALLKSMSQSLLPLSMG